MDRTRESIEPLVEEAIGLLESHGLALHAGSLRECLARLDAAPTAAARRRRARQLALPAVTFARLESRAGAIRWHRTEADRRDEGRYRRLLEAMERSCFSTRACVL